MLWASSRPAVVPSIAQVGLALASEARLAS
jgi:hypothetical protein